MPAWHEMTQEQRNNMRLRSSARSRALSRLSRLHPEDYRRLFEEELEDGPMSGKLAGRTAAPRKPVDPELVQQIRRMAAAGWSDAEMAIKLWLSHGQVVYLRGQHNIAAGRRRGHHGPWRDQRAGGAA